MEVITAIGICELRADMSWQWTSDSLITINSHGPNGLEMEMSWIWLSFIPGVVHMLSFHQTLVVRNEYSADSLLIQACPHERMCCSLSRSVCVCVCERERERKKDIYTPQRTIYSINLIQSLNQQSPCYLCGCKSSLAICWCLFDSGEGRDTYRCGYLTVCLSDVRDGIAFIYMDVWVWNR